MSANYRKLGDYITQRREKNTAINLPICGVCREGLIPPKQQDADISLYNVFYKNDFIFNPARMELNSITLNTEYDKAICSSLYEIFYINDTSKLLPEFLFVQLKTDNFVRFCEFQGQGSVREYCRFANISEYPVIVPDLKEQKKIVSTYNAITKRIQLKQKINENLEKTAQTIYKKMFVEDADLTLGKLKDFCSVFTGFPFDSELYSDSDGIKTLRGENVTEEKLRWNTLKRYKGEITDRIEKNYLHEWDIVIGMDGSKIGKNWSLVHDFDLPLLLAQRVACLRTSSISKQLFLYISLKIRKFTEYVTQVNTGTTILHISGSQIEDFPVLLPNDTVLEDFGKKVIPLYEQRRNNIDEINKLQIFKQIVISRISGM